MSQYIGRRIVPVHGGVWDNSKNYEELTIVLHEASGDSYISRRPVPAGTVIGDKNYWMLYSLYSQQIADAVAQMEETDTALRKELSDTEGRIENRVSNLEILTNSLDARLEANVAASTDNDFDYAAEVIDARVDNEGVSYLSLGTHIRCVASDIKQEVGIVIPTYELNGLNNDGEPYIFSARARTKEESMIQISAGDYVASDGMYEYRIGIYKNKKYNSDSFVCWYNEWAIGRTKIKKEYEGCYAALLIRLASNSGQDMEKEVANIKSHLAYFPNRMLAGLISNTTDICEQSKEYLDRLGILIGYDRVRYNGYVWEIGGVGTSGHKSTTETRMIPTAKSMPLCSAGDTVVSDGVYAFRVGIFNKREYSEDALVCWYNDWTVEDVTLTNEYAGDYIAILVRDALDAGKNLSEVLDDVDAHISLIQSDVASRISGLEQIADNFKEKLNESKELINELWKESGMQCFKGLKVAIMGDSISTNGNQGNNANAVEITITEKDVGVELRSYITYYDVKTNNLVLGGHEFTENDIGTEVTFIPDEEDVGKVIGLPNNYNANITKVWWEVLCEALAMEPIPVCWAGASITSHEKGNQLRACSWGWHESQIRKCGIRVPGSMERLAPDVIIIYMGTNDFSHSPYTILTNGYFDNINFEYPKDDLLEDGNYGFLEGYTILISRLRETYPSAKLFLCTLNVFKRIKYDKFPTRNGLNTLPQYSSAIKKLADYMGCGIIDFAADGITFENCYSEGYVTDSIAIPTHPSERGHLVMGNKAIADFKSQYSSMV